MRDEGVTYVAGYPLLNSRCTSKMTFVVSGGALNSTHSPESAIWVQMADFSIFWTRVWKTSVPEPSVCSRNDTQKMTRYRETSK